MRQWAPLLAALALVCASASTSTLASTGTSADAVEQPPRYPVALTAAEGKWLIVVVLYHLLGVYERVQDNGKDTKWANVARVYPTYQLWRGHFEPSDNNGPSQVCADWATAFTSRPYSEGDLLSCWMAMSRAVGDPIGQLPPQGKSRSPELKMMLRGVMAYYSVMVAVEFSRTYTAWEPKSFNEWKQIVPGRTCGTVGVGSQDSEFNGAYENIRPETEEGGTWCTGYEFGSVCNIVCKSGFISSKHWGHTAVCALNAASGALQWKPAGLAYQQMCVRDLVQSTKGVMFDLSGWNTIHSMMPDHTKMTRGAMHEPCWDGLSLADGGCSLSSDEAFLHLPTHNGDGSLQFSHTAGYGKSLRVVTGTLDETKLSYFVVARPTENTWSSFKELSNIIVWDLLEQSLDGSSSLAWAEFRSTFLAASNRTGCDGVWQVYTVLLDVKSSSTAYMHVRVNGMPFDNGAPLMLTLKPAIYTWEQIVPAFQSSTTSFASSRSMSLLRDEVDFAAALNASVPTTMKDPLGGVTYQVCIRPSPTWRGGPLLASYQWVSNGVQTDDDASPPAPQQGDESGQSAQQAGTGAGTAGTAGTAGASESTADSGDYELCAAMLMLSCGNSMYEVRLVSTMQGGSTATWTVGALQQSYFTDCSTETDPQRKPATEGYYTSGPALCTSCDATAARASSAPAYSVKAVVDAGHVRFMINGLDFGTIHSFGDTNIATKWGATQPCTEDAITIAGGLLGEGQKVKAVVLNDTAMTSRRFTGQLFNAAVRPYAVTNRTDESSLTAAIRNECQRPTGPLKTALSDEVSLVKDVEESGLTGSFCIKSTSATGAIVHQKDDTGTCLMVHMRTDNTVEAKIRCTGCPCVSPTTVAGYDSTDVIDENLHNLQFKSVGWKCAADYTGTPVATQCARPGEPYTLSGCTASPGNTHTAIPCINPTTLPEGFAVQSNVYRGSSRCSWSGSMDEAVGTTPFTMVLSFRPGSSAFITSLGTTGMELVRMGDATKAIVVKQTNSKVVIGYQSGDQSSGALELEDIALTTTANVSVSFTVRGSPTANTIAAIPARTVAKLTGLSTSPTTSQITATWTGTASPYTITVVLSGLTWKPSDGSASDTGVAVTELAKSSVLSDLMSTTGDFIAITAAPAVAVDHISVAIVWDGQRYGSLYTINRAGETWSTTPTAHAEWVSAGGINGLTINVNSGRLGCSSADPAATCTHFSALDAITPCIGEAQFIPMTLSTPSSTMITPATGGTQCASMGSSVAWADTHNSVYMNIVETDLNKGTFDVSVDCTTGYTLRAGSSLTVAECDTADTPYTITGFCDPDSLELATLIGADVYANRGNGITSRNDGGSKPITGTRVSCSAGYKKMGTRRNGEEVPGSYPAMNNACAYAGCVVDTLVPAGLVTIKSAVATTPLNGDYHAFAIVVRNVKKTTASTSGTWVQFYQNGEPLGSEIKASLAGTNWAPMYSCQGDVSVGTSLALETLSTAQRRLVGFSGTLKNVAVHRYALTTEEVLSALSNCEAGNIIVTVGHGGAMPPAASRMDITTAYDGAIGEFLAYNAFLDPRVTDRYNLRRVEALEWHLASKWGLTHSIFPAKPYAPHVSQAEGSTTTDVGLVMQGAGYKGRPDYVLNLVVEQPDDKGSYALATGSVHSISGRTSQVRVSGLPKGVNRFTVVANLSGFPACGLYDGASRNHTGDSTEYYVF